MKPEYLEQMQAHLDEGGRLQHRNAVELLAEVRARDMRGRELAKALSTCITAMNPQDRGGISMHEWNQRLKAATKQACAVFDGSDSVTGGNDA